MKARERRVGMKIGSCWSFGFAVKKKTEANSSQPFKKKATAATSIDAPEVLLFYPH